MSLVSRVNDLATAVGADIKALQASVAANSAALLNPPVRVLGVQTPAITGTISAVGTGPVFNTLAEVEVFNVPIVAGRLATGDIIEADLVFDAFNSHTANVNATIRYYIDTTMLYQNAVSLLASQTNRFRIPSRSWAILSSPTTLRGAAYMLASTTANGTANMNGLLAVAQQAAGSLADQAVPDLTVARNFRVTCQLSVQTTVTDVRPLAIVLKRTRPGTP